MGRKQRTEGKEKASRKKQKEEKRKCKGRIKWIDRFKTFFFKSRNSYIRKGTELKKGRESKENLGIRQGTFARQQARIARKVKSLDFQIHAQTIHLILWKYFSASFARNFHCLSPPPPPFFYFFVSRCSYHFKF